MNDAPEWLDRSGREFIALVDFLIIGWLILSVGLTTCRVLASPRSARSCRLRGHHVAPPQHHLDVSSVAWPGPGAGTIDLLSAGGASPVPIWGTLQHATSGGLTSSGAGLFHE